MNTGTLTRQKGTPTQVNLAIRRADKTTCNVLSPNASWNDGTWLSQIAYATTTQNAVPPGQLGTFTYTFRPPFGIEHSIYTFNGDLVHAGDAPTDPSRGLLASRHSRLSPAPAPAGVPSALGPLVCRGSKERGRSPLSCRAGDRDASCMYKIDVLDLPISVERAVFLAGHVECPDCRAHVRPSVGTKAFVRAGASIPAAAWCSVCCNTRLYVMEPTSTTS